MRGWATHATVILTLTCVCLASGCATLEAAGGFLPKGSGTKPRPKNAEPMHWDPAAPPMMLTIGYDQGYAEHSEAPERWPRAWVQPPGPPLPEGVVAGHAYEWRDEPSIEPVSHPDRWICSLFGPRGRHMHNGLDIKAPRRSPVVATAHGVVVKAGWVRGYGRLVVLGHGGGVQTLYAHLSKALVKEGEGVTRGQEIGTVGSTGRSTCAHVHYEVRINGEPVDPIDYVPREFAQRIE